MRRLPMPVWGFLALIPLTGFGLVAAVSEGDGPYDGETTFTTTRLIDRKELGYTNESQYMSQQTDARFSGRLVWDSPYQPAGAPARKGSELPPLMQRTTIYWIDGRLILLPIGLTWAAWGIWLALFIRKRQLMGVNGRGFEMSVRSAPSDSRESVTHSRESLTHSRKNAPHSRENVSLSRTRAPL